MAGSIEHITGDDGKFTMELIENLGDAHEALEECFEHIRELEAQLAQSRNATLDEVAQIVDGEDAYIYSVEFAERVRQMKEGE